MAIVFYYAVLHFVVLTIFLHTSNSRVEKSSPRHKSGKYWIAFPFSLHSSECLALDFVSSWKKLIINDFISHWIKNSRVHFHNWPYRSMCHVCVCYVTFCRLTWADNEDKQKQIKLLKNNKYRYFFLNFYMGNKLLIFCEILIYRNDCIF